MNYRHTYHAGNFADAFKHIILIALMKSMMRKDNGFCFLDTHAGIGLYDLMEATTQKSKEYETGIAKIRAGYNPPPLIKEYLACVDSFNANKKKLQFYPGSPAIATHFLRPQDRAVLTELHEEDSKTLKQYFYHNQQVSVHHQDGYQGLKAHLPPKERRGIVLIDPPYEKQNELEDLNGILGQALKRWETGVFALWYPIKMYSAIERFHRAVKQNIQKPVLVAELSIYPETSATSLNGSGMLIINPPFQLDTEIKGIMPWLWARLSADKLGRHEVKML